MKTAGFPPKRQNKFFVVRKRCYDKLSDSAVHISITESLCILTYIIEKHPSNCTLFALNSAENQLKCSSFLQTLFLQVTGQRLVPSFRKWCVCFAVICIVSSMGTICFHFYEPFLSIWALPCYIFSSTATNSVIGYWVVTFRSLITAGRSLSACFKVQQVLYKVICQKISLKFVCRFSIFKYSKIFLDFIVGLFHYFFTEPCHN